jgi:hypothetical protein
MSAPAKKKSNKGALFLLLVLVVAQLVMWNRTGNPLSTILKWWSSDSTTLGEATPPSHLPRISDTSLWTNLKLSGVLPISIPEQGRNNPFVYQIAPDTPQHRDEQRLKNLRILIDGLADYHRQKGIYPAGTNIQLGSTAAVCLTDQGWVDLANCNRPNISILVANLSPDPAGRNFIYNSVGPSYVITFTLENSWGSFAAGEHSLTPLGIE